MSSGTRYLAYSSGVFAVALWGILAVTAQAQSAESHKGGRSGKSAEAGKGAARGEAAKSVHTVEPAKGATPKAEEKGTKAEEKSATPKPEETAAEANLASILAKVARDPDFVLQGEFVGPVSTAGAKYERLALQIRPMGEGTFEAIQYPGGLPGEPAHRPTPTPLTLVGKRWEKSLVLSGGPWAVFVETDHCLLIDRQGQRVGRLERVVRQSPTLGAPPPKDAIVLFDGKGTSQFTAARITADGLLMEGADLKPLFQDFNLHVEFLLPYLPAARDQGRANSGVYLLSRYELQILDSFAQEPLFNGCGSMYRFRKPDVNMCLPPLVWQTYDIVFTAPRWAADDTKLKNARVTVWQNGVRIQNNVELPDKTGAGKPEEQTLLPTRFQDHRNPVRFRNIWLVDRGAAPPVGFPVFVGGSAQQPHGPAADSAPQASPQKPAARASKARRADADGK